jgi:hypothetical protein
VQPASLGRPVADGVRENAAVDVVELREQEATRMESFRLAC